MSNDKRLTELDVLRMGPRSSPRLGLFSRAGRGGCALGRLRATRHRYCANVLVFVSSQSPKLRKWRRRPKASLTIAQRIARLSIAKKIEWAKQEGKRSGADDRTKSVQPAFSSDGVLVMVRRIAGPKLVVLENYGQTFFLLYHPANQSRGEDHEGCDRHRRRLRHREVRRAGAIEGRL